MSLWEEGPTNKITTANWPYISSEFQAPIVEIAYIVHPHSSCKTIQKSINFSSMSYIWRAQKGHPLVSPWSSAVQPESPLVRVLSDLPFPIILCNWSKELGKSAKIKGWWAGFLTMKTGKLPGKIWCRDQSAQFVAISRKFCGKSVSVKRVEPQTLGCAISRCNGPMMSCSMLLEVATLHF